ncbi:hypothetical protein [Gloeothece verrucosa]|uniref:VWFA domain-containing protein n=1 Tax=Gloeothece verrucosa (strain PCC 7822) TaxID=497965 RepID=E0UNW5_GLOV7|nr:hypothetical protein [Gloeothece verrucosa]ADN18645.1 conserved hypothetical protein [Gloeothece verrucosa PCC 7822]
MIQPQFQLKRYLVALATFFLLVSCKSPSVYTEQDFPCKLETNISSVSSSSPLEIALHVDGSGSMLGYVDNPNSRYIQTLDLLDSIFLGQGSRDQVTLSYYRSGGLKNQQLNRQQYRNAFNPDFYTGTNPTFPKVSSQLDKAITPPAKTDKLLVFVTDLEQNGGDVNNLVDTIEKNFFKDKHNQYSVGILAIKSEFNGTIYTTEPRVYSDFYYNTKGEKIDQYRPFYVVFIAPYSDLVYYYEAMKNQAKDLIESSQLVIFSPNTFIKESGYPKLSTPLPNEISNPQSLQIGRVAFESSQSNSGQSSYTLLEIPKRIDQKELSIPFTLPFSPTDYTLLPEPEKIKTETTIKASNSFEKKFLPQNNNASLKQALEIKDLKLTDNQFTFTTAIQPESFSEPGIYLFTIDLRVENLQDASWWKDWDWESRTNSEDGSKTYNLLNFMRNLKTRMTDGETKPAISRFCYAIQKN